MEALSDRKTLLFQQWIEFTMFLNQYFACISTESILPTGAEILGIGSFVSTGFAMWLCSEQLWGHFNTIVLGQTKNSAVQLLVWSWIFQHWSVNQSWKSSENFVQNHIFLKEISEAFQKWLPLADFFLPNLEPEISNAVQPQPGRCCCLCSAVPSVHLGGCLLLEDISESV